MKKNFFSITEKKKDNNKSFLIFKSKIESNSCHECGAEISKSFFKLWVIIVFHLENFLLIKKFLLVKQNKTKL